MGSTPAEVRRGVNSGLRSDGDLACPSQPFDSAKTVGLGQTSDVGGHHQNSRSVLLRARQTTPKELTPDRSRVNSKPFRQHGVPHVVAGRTANLGYASGARRCHG